MIRRRCKSHVRTDIGLVVRCQLARGHSTIHAAWLGLVPITWTTK